MRRPGRAHGLEHPMTTCAYRQKLADSDPQDRAVTGGVRAGSRLRGWSGALAQTARLNPAATIDEVGIICNPSHHSKASNHPLNVGGGHRLGVTAVRGSEEPPGISHRSLARS